MPKLQFYVSNDIAQTAKSRARTAGKSLSSYLADLLIRSLADEWPEGFFEEVAGGWKGEPLESANTNRIAGSARDIMRIAADFNAPLDDFAEYTVRTGASERSAGGSPAGPPPARRQ